MIEQVKRYIEQHNIIKDGDKILCGVSGGVDSMVMVDILASLGYDVAIAHCNFSLRPGDAELDQEHVRLYAQAMGIPFFTVKFDTAGYSKSKGLSTQMAARELRYEWFEKLMQGEGYNKIAIAHNADDSIETFFINLLRGTGVKGLTGIQRVRGAIIRPLLSIYREDIESYSQQKELHYRTDKSNLHDTYLRNWVRLNLLPMAEQRVSGFRHMMTENIRRIGSSTKLLERLVDDVRKRAVKEYYNEYKIDLGLIYDYGECAGQLLYELIERFGFSAVQASDILLHRHSGRLFYSDKNVALMDREVLIIQPRDCFVNNLKDNMLVINSVDDVATELFSLAMIPIEECGDYRKTPPGVAYLDGDKVSFPLIVRRVRQGDRFSPLGIRGAKKVSDFLIDIKCSRFEKEMQLVMESHGEIAWLVERRVSDKFKIDSKTQRVLKIAYITDKL